MVKVDIAAQTQRVIGLVLIGSSFGLFAMQIEDLLFSLSSSIHFHPFLVLILLLWISQGILFIKLAPRRQHTEDRRQAASAGSLEITLATEQPIPNVAALTLPIMFQLRPRWTTIVAWTAIILALSVCYFSLSFIGSDTLNFLLIALASASITFLFGGSLIWVACHYQRLEVREGEITIWHSGSKTSKETIRWQDVRLFALLPANLLNKRDYLPTHYELSGPNGIVRWTRVRRKMPFSFGKLCKPAIPFDEYDRQMDALLAVIAAKTGLPLYDLR